LPSLFPVRTRTLVSALLVVTLGGALTACAPGSEDSSAHGGSSSTGDNSEVATAATALSATSGSVTGGEQVVITGTGLDTVTAVNFGATPAPIASASSTELTVTVPQATAFAPASVEVTLGAGDAAVEASALTYSYEILTPVDAQMNYVLTHWQNRNEAEYGSYGDNDCVNFTSQSLIARGWVQDSEWWHTASGGSHQYSSPWLSSTSMKKYFDARPNLATALTDDQRDQVVIGDIVQFDWDNSGDRDHTGIVSRIEGEGAERVIYFAGHSLDSDYRSVDTAITTDHPGGTAYYWHLEA
jgi:hypothetical protein